MLTIHTPIGLTVNPSILKMNDNFTERLMGNYQIIGNGLEPEDMLHFLSEPPELYLAEGGMTSLIENTKIYENQNLKLDVINNVLNRILVSDTYQMTYQDQVFIESVLKKMGISNVQEFIRQVRNHKEETKNVTYLTDLYWEQQETVAQLLEYRKMQAERGTEPAGEEQDEKEAHVLWLHQEILNRLQTGAVYQELKNYVSTTANYHQMISAEEMKISEQNVMAQNILLNKLRNYTMMEEQPLVYHYINTYEMGDEVMMSTDNRRSVSQMVQAVLLNALHQMYALRVEDLVRQENVWYHLAGNIYQAAENTFNRFATYHGQNFISNEVADTYSKEVQQYQKNEIKAIEQLYQEQQLNNIRNTNITVYPQEELQYLPQEGADEDIENAYAEETSDSIREVVQQTEMHGQQIQHMTKQENLLKNQLEQINQNNIRNLQLLQQLNIQNVTEEKPGRINRAKAMEDALRVLSEPEEVLMTYLDRETTVEQTQITGREHLKQVFGEETIRIFETLEKYQKLPQYQNGIGLPGQSEAMLMRDIQIEEQAHRAELIHKIQSVEQETVQEIETAQLFKTYMPEQIKQVRKETQKQIDRIELVHKQEETSIEEEVLEEIRGLHRTTRIENEQTSQQVIEKNTSQEIVNTRINEFQTRQNEELIRIMTDKVQNQIGAISEQIYGKLEKRMDTERRRRGL